MFLPYVLCLKWLKDLPSQQGGHGALLWMILAAAALARLHFAFHEPLLSDDLYRYVWDGRVASHGINPFLHAPDAPALKGLRDAQIWPGINHKHVPTIYPPASQALFWLNAELGGALISLKLLWLALEAAAMALAAWLLRERGWSRQELTLAAAIYALNPTVCVEVAWSGHLDVLAYGALTLALLCGSRPTSRERDPFLSGLWFGVSVAAKLLPMVLLPLLLFSPRRRESWPITIRRRVTLGVVALGVVALSYLPLLDAGPKLFSGFGTYASTWRGNDGAFRALAAASEESVRAWAPLSSRLDQDDPSSKVIITLSGLESTFHRLKWTKIWRGEQVAANTFAEDQIAQTTAKVVVAALMALAMLWALQVTRSPALGALMLLTALFFLAPTIYPWYVAWLVPLAAIERRRVAVSALVFSLVALTAYVAWARHATGGAWSVPWWVAAIASSAVLSAAYWDAVRFGRSKANES